jgi:glycosyltransferase involved in cell wall biosynthesis
MARVVMFVYNDVRNDARVLREAATLAAAGHRVTVIGRPTDVRSMIGGREDRDGFDIVRVPLPWRWRIWWGWIKWPWGMRGWAVRRTRANARSPLGWLKIVGIWLAMLLSIPWMLIRLPFHLRARSRRTPPGGSTPDFVVRWRYVIEGWARQAAIAAPAADVYHGHDLTALSAAIDAQTRNGGQVVYDSHEIYLESGANVHRPGWVRRWLVRKEARWIARCAALVTVNQPLAEELGRRYHPSRTVVVHNAPARWDPPAERPDLIRSVTGIPPGEPIALYHGGFSLHRGLEELAAAILEPGLERVHAVYLGYGGQRKMLDRMAADPTYGGRVHVIDAVPPDELLPWVASADVAVMPIQPSTLNHRLSTPNKLFEGLAAGLPVAVSDFPAMREIVLDDPDAPLGAVCRPDDPADVARAIRSIIDLSPAEYADLRRRCLRAAHERWNWETESGHLVGLYEELAARFAS